MTEAVISDPAVVAVSQPEAPAVEESEKDNSWMGMLVNVAISLVLVIAVLAAYHFMFVVPNKQKFAVIDIAEVLQLKELEVTAASSGQGVTDAHRGEAFESITKFASSIEQAIAELQHDCACTLLVRAAVIKSPETDDLTPALKQKLGMENLDQTKLLQQIRSIKGAGKAPGE
jgi:hypothetical protein